MDPGLKPKPPPRKTRAPIADQKSAGIDKAAPIPRRSAHTPPPDPSGTHRQSVPTPADPVRAAMGERPAAIQVSPSPSSPALLQALRDAAQVAAQGTNGRLVMQYFEAAMSEADKLLGPGHAPEQTYEVLVDAFTDLLMEGARVEALFAKLQPTDLLAIASVRSRPWREWPLNAAHAHLDYIRTKRPSAK